MYQSDFICTYKLHSKEDQADMYRIQLLQAFDVMKWDDTAIDTSVKTLFEQIGKHKDIQRILQRAKTSKCCESVVMLVDSEDYTIFSNLFQYDLFDLFHRCICDVVSRKRVDPIHMEMLFKAME